MNVQGASQLRGTPIIQWPHAGAANEEWHVVWVNRPNMVCKLVSLLSGQVMAVAGNKTEPGTSVIQWPYVNAPGHHWQVVWVDNSQSLCKLVSLITDKQELVMAVAGNSRDNGAGIILWPYVNAPGHHWKLSRLEL
jgi:hypothetical protein